MGGKLNHLMPVFLSCVFALYLPLLCSSSSKAAADVDWHSQQHRRVAQALRNPNLNQAIKQFTEDWHRRHTRPLEEVHTGRRSLSSVHGDGGDGGEALRGGDMVQGDQGYAETRVVARLGRDGSTWSNPTNLGTMVGDAPRRRDVGRGSPGRREPHGRVRHRAGNGQGGGGRRGAAVGTHTRTQTPTDLQTPYGQENGTVNGSTCSQCRIQENIKMRRMEAIKAQILSKLGLDAPPNITGTKLPNNPALRKIIEQYDMQSDMPFQGSGDRYDQDTSNEYHATTYRVMNMATRPPARLGINESDVLYFTFTQKVMGSRIHRAMFYVYIKKPRNLHKSYIRIRVFQVHLPKQPGQAHTETQVGREKINIRAGSRWCSFDLKTVVEDWIMSRNPEDNFGLLKVVAEDHRGRSLAILHPQEEVDQPFVPFLDISVHDYKNSRNKRMIGLVCHIHTREDRCCRHHLSVDFEDFGWDWIIAPKKYTANYCSGDCPFVFLQEYPHTHVVQQANPHASAGPCCTPKRLSPISMLYFDGQQNIIYGKLPGMVVDLCGCS